MKGAHHLKWILLFLSLTITLPKARGMDPRLGVVLNTAAYGAVGGALLGTATMAFGANSRAIFQGASLGLYAGLAFGGYVLWSHREDEASSGTEGQYPDDPQSPYSYEDYPDQSSVFGEGFQRKTAYSGDFGPHGQHHIFASHQKSGFVFQKPLQSSSVLAFYVPMVDVRF